MPQPKIILVVDDDEDHMALVHRSFEDQMERGEVRLVEAESIERARELLDKIRPDLAIVDWKLGDGSGTDLLPGPGADTPFPILIMTGYPSEGAGVDAVRKGAVDYVQKSEDTLREMPRYAERALRKWLEQKRGPRAINRERLAEIGTFAGVVISHDLSNLVGAAQNYGKLILNDMRDGKSGANTLKHAESLLQCVEQAALAIRRFRAAFKEIQPKPTIFDIEETVREQVELGKPLVPEQIAITVQADRQAKYCRGDQLQFRLAVMELIKNGVDAIGLAKGEIVIRLSSVAEGQEAGNSPILAPFHLVEVSDNGKGMRKIEQERIFDAFYSTKPDGLGLGMFSVRTCAKSFSGEVTVISEPNVGTKFSFYIPSVSASKEKNEPDLALLYKGNSEHLVLVDDERHFLESTAEILRQLGYLVSAFTNGEEAFNHIKNCEGKVDLLLVDKYMPKLAGPEYLKQVRASYPNIPAILVTGYGGVVADRKQARRLGFQDYLEKPIEGEDLARSVFTVIGESRTHA